ncbi:hypothetical protein DSECCO2_389690 [anaerobic digester metagenome]
MNRPEHGRPGLPDHQEPAGAGRNGFPRPVDDVHDGARDGLSGKPRFHRLADHRGHHVHPGLGLPPCIHDRAPPAADRAVVPLECLGVERFADRAEHPERREVVFRRPLFAHPHEHPDGGRGGVEDRHPQILDQPPVGAGVGVVRRPFGEDDGRADLERAVDDVTVAGDPAGVGGAPVDVVLLDVEDVAGGVVGSDRIPAAGVHDALRGAGRTARVEDEERVFRVHRLRRAVGCGTGHQVGVIDLPVGVEFDGRRLAPEDDDPLDARRMGERLAREFAERDGLSPAVTDVCGDENLRLRVVDPHRERVRPEPTEDHRVDGPDPGAGEHRDDLLGDERHVDADAVALLDPEAREAVCKPHHLAVQGLVGQDPLLSALPVPDDRRLILTAPGDVAVQAARGDVQFSVDEPFRIGVVPLPDPVPGLEPVELAGDPVPEPFRVAQELAVGPRVVRRPGGRLAPGIGVVALLFQFHGECFCHFSSFRLHSSSGPVWPVIVLPMHTGRRQAVPVPAGRNHRRPLFCVAVLDFT